MGIKLGDISPLAGLATGAGRFGKIARSGLLGLAPMAVAKDAYSQAKDEEEEQRRMQAGAPAMKKGGAVKKYAKGGAVSASKRGDGIAQRGKTKGRMV